MKRIKTFKFDSMIDLANEIHARKDSGLTYLRDAASLLGDDNTTYTPDFFGNTSFEEALATAAQGGDWSEGAKHIAPVSLDDIDLGIPKLIPALYNDVQGFMPDVPAHLAGVPNDMLDIEQVPRGQKIIRIAVAIGRLMSVTQPSIYNRGNAILSIVDTLENLGYSVELWAIWRNNVRGREVSIDTCIKQANQFWSPSSVAFALCHAAMNRRLMWSLVENTKECCHFVNSGYGSGGTACYTDFDIAFSYVTKNDYWDTPKIARETAVAEVREQLTATVTQE